MLISPSSPFNVAAAPECLRGAPGRNGGPPAGAVGRSFTAGGHGRGPPIPVSLTLYSLGHSTRGLEEFLQLLERHGVAAIADVRRWPASRRHPHFGRPALEEAAGAAGIAYHWLGQTLGGYRRAGEVKGADAPRFAGMRSDGFRAYAAHLQTPAAAPGLRRLLELAANRPTAMVCAEAHPSRCHRRLIADLLVARGHRVLHIPGPGPPEPHRLTPGAEVEAGLPAYPGSARLPDL